MMRDGRKKILYQIKGKEKGIRDMMLQREDSQDRDHEIFARKLLCNCVI